MRRTTVDRSLCVSLFGDNVTSTSVVNSCNLGDAVVRVSVAQQVGFRKRMF